MRIERWAETRQWDLLHTRLKQEDRANKNLSEESTGGLRRSFSSLRIEGSLRMPSFPKHFDFCTMLRLPSLRIQERHAKRTKMGNRVAFRLLHS